MAPTQGRLGAAGPRLDRAILDTYGHVIPSLAEEAAAASTSTRPPVVQVVDTRYQAGRFGSGFKPRPKSVAGIREVHLPPLRGFEPLTSVMRTQGSHLATQPAAPPRTMLPSSSVAWRRKL
jgi:hypothetical protein